MKTVAFAGTIVSVETRFSTTVKRAIDVGELDARWVMTVDVDAADHDAPAAEAERVSFLIHSPSHTLMTGDPVVGRRYAFTLDRHDTRDGVRWSGLLSKTP